MNRKDFALEWKALFSSDPLRVICDDGVEEVTAGEVLNGCGLASEGARGIQMRRKSAALLYKEWLLRICCGREVHFKPSLVDGIDCSAGALKDASSYSVFPPQEVFGYFYSSGTEDHISCTPRSCRSVANEIAQWISELRIQAGQVIGALRPLSYAGTVMLSIAATYVKCKVIFLGPPNEENFHKLEECDLILASPRDIRKIARLSMRHGCLLGKTIILTGEASDYSTNRYVTEVLRADLAVSWGVSNGMGTIMTGRESGSKITSSGRAFVGERIEIVSSHCDHKLGLIAGCFKTVDGRSDQLCEGGLMYLASNDYGWIDKDGYLYFAARERDRHLAEKIFPRFIFEIEEQLRHLNLEAEVAVVSLDVDGSGSNVGVVFESGPSDFSAKATIALTSYGLRCVAEWKVLALPESYHGKVARGLIRRELLRRINRTVL